MQYVKNMTDNDKQHILKLSLRFVEHEDFSEALPQKEPQTVLDSPHLFYPEDRRKERHRLIILLLLKDLLNALRCFLDASPGSPFLWDKLRLVLHFFSLIRNYLLHTILNEILKL